MSRTGSPWPACRTRRRRLSGPWTSARCRRACSACSGRCSATTSRSAASARARATTLSRCSAAPCRTSRRCRSGTPRARSHAARTTSHALNSFARLPVTFGLMGACVAVYLAVAFAGQGYGYPLNVALVTQPPEVLALGALVPASVADGQVWLLVSSMFLHAGFIHLALNMLSLYFLGSFVEVAFGRGRFLALYLTSGLAGGIAYLYFGNFDGSVVGASGAIFGLLGGVLGYSLRRGTFSWQNPLIRQLLILTALNLYIGFSVPNISNTAHIGGLVGGLAFGWLVAPTVYSKKTLRAATPTIIVVGMEMILLATWFVFFT